MPRDPRTVPVPLTMHRFSTAPQAIDEGCCLSCDVYLDLDQPDAQSPDRMVGVCDRCGRWYLIDVTPGTEEAVMVLLPAGGYFMDALTRRPA